MASLRYALTLVLFAGGVAFVSRAYLVKHKSIVYQPSVGRHDSEGSINSSRPYDKSTVRTPNLEITSITHHGRIIEVEGTTDPGAIVMINGEPAATLFGNSTFKHFVRPISAGPNIITVTAQNDQGGVTTRQLIVPVD